ncbi:MaoC family dehydratase [Palleronia abyssalis]|uniref:MaoC-like domain-containing protein n=1 Tax=Palleronia abyssalis TaxID=1501240 RepID=A0A2R8BZ25_9RHOB|nr:MaoC family dehydratase [Palleronia abyssalis]SPJ25425.1 hypothetical protein PAA8504_03276 [Palleronia abyssalis]
MTRLAPDSEIVAPPRAMTRERMRWYVDAQATAVANDGRPRHGGPTIHDDDDYALAQGLPGIIADGMVSTNWILALMIDTFGAEAAQSGRLRTKYVRPVYEDDVLRSRLRITERVATEDGDRIRMDVFCEMQDGTPVTVGEAEVLVRDA